jgi:hypothetical protein
LVNLFKESLLKRPQGQQAAKYDEIVSIILRRRRLYFRKFIGSTLEKTIMLLTNENI